MDIVSWAILILSTFVTFGLFSVLSGIDNPFFAWAEQTYVGVAIGLATVVTVDYLIANVYVRVSSNPSAGWPLIISLILGLMMLTRIHPKYAHWARIPIAVSTGAGIAVSTRAIIFSSIINQIRATILPLVGGGDPLTVVTNLLVIVFVIVIITFFIYTTELKGPLKVSHDLGRYCLYAAFGVLFAQTYMGRLGLLLGRMETMLIPMNPSGYVTVIVAVIIVVSIYVLNKYYPDTLQKLVPE